ncbi:MAG: hypothetical protein WEB58_15485 [Planctomycetaceae bacterium]
MKREYPQSDEKRSTDVLEQNSQVDVLYPEKTDGETPRGARDTKTARIKARAELAREKSQPNAARALVLITWAACAAVMAEVAIFAVFVKDEMTTSMYVAGVIAVMAVLMGTLSLFNPPPPSPRDENS